ncbi:MAG: hypothetical protein ACRCYM_02680 [Cetobacterium sp.]
MAEKRPRVVVEDLQGNKQLESAADPRFLDHYVRPGEQQIGGPAKTNPLLQLSEALSQLDSDLKPVVAQASQKWITEEEAKGERARFEQGREKANEMIRKGEIPLGMSPWAERGYKRAHLKEMGTEYYNTVFQAFQGEAGAAARESNDPAEMQKLLDTSYKSFSKDWLENGKFSSLDLQDVFNPAIAQANSNLMRAHADHRVKEVERRYEEHVSTTSTKAMEQALSQLTPEATEEERTIAHKNIAEKLNGLLYDPDTGAVKNGMFPGRGNDLLRESVLNFAKANGDRSAIDVLDHITTKSGASIANTVQAQAQILAAKEHITAKEIQEENHRWQMEQRPHQRAALQRQPQELAMQDERWKREIEGWSETKQHRAEKDILSASLRRLYEGLDNPNSKEGVKQIDDVMRVAKQFIPDKVEHLEQILHVTSQRRTSVPDDKGVWAATYKELLADPMNFDETSLLAKSKGLSQESIKFFIHEAQRLQGHAGHRFMRHPEVSEMLGQISRGALQNKEDEFGAEGPLRQSQAMASFRDRAAIFIKKNPEASQEEFNEYLRDQMKPILERVNPDFGKAQQVLRDKEVAKGQMVVEKTSAAIKQRGEQESAARTLDDASKQLQKRMAGGREK